MRGARTDVLRPAVSTLAVVVLAVGLAAESRGAVVEWLYEVDVPVANQGADERTEAARVGLATVLTRITGEDDLTGFDAVAEALRTPERYFIGYEYRTGTTPEVPLLVRLSFAPDAVRGLASGNGLPLWSSNRPTVIAWVAVDAGGERRVLGAGDGHSLGAALIAHARDRGIELTLPEMDPEDVLELPTDDVWNRDWDALRTASAPYGGDTVLAGRVTRSSTGRWIADWVYQYATDQVAFALETGTPEAAAVGAADAVAQVLAGAYAVAAAPNEDLALQVDGVDGVEAYAAMLAYLGHLDYVDGVQVDQVRRDAVWLHVRTRTPWPQLEELFALDGRLVPEPSYESDPRYEASDPSYRRYERYEESDRLAVDPLSRHERLTWHAPAP